MNKIRERHIVYSEKVFSRKHELMKKSRNVYLENRSAFNFNRLKHTADEFSRYSKIHIKKLEKYYNTQR